MLQALKMQSLMKYILRLKNIIILLILVAITSCNFGDTRKNIDLSGIDLNLKINRFEQDLFALDTNKLFAATLVLREKYPVFYPLYMERMMRFGNSDDSVSVKRLHNFLTNKAIRGLYDSCQAQYKEMTDIQSELKNGFKHFKYYFPDKFIPEIVTFISEFGYGAVTYDSLLGIGLDMYLGSNYIYYPSVGFPYFFIRKLDRPYIVRNSLLNYIQGVFEASQNNQKQLLQNMVQMGKELYVLTHLLPNAPDSILIGYSQKQLDWCKDNEHEVWAFFIKHELLYSNDVSEVRKFITDAPTTSGMPHESPGNIGSWVGLQIVTKYMNNHSSVSLKELMNEHDAQKILTKSKYRP